MVHSDAKSVSIPGGDLSALIARLEAAEAGSAELDEAVALGCGSKTQGWAEWASDGTFLGSIRPYTTSLDAALALAERVVGDREWMVEGKDRPLGRVHRACLGIVGPVYASTPALALCIAVLKAVNHAK